MIDEGDNQALAKATVETVGEPVVKATTGADGKARLDLPPGVYSIKATADQYDPVTIQKLTVVAGKAIGTTAKLKQKATATTPSKQTIEVTAVVKEASEATQLQQRKEATVVGDSLGAEAISKTTDSSAAEVVTRAPSVTTRDDKYIVVRGLTERYSGALLNGSRLPSTDPNRRIVPLDIFPADFIEALNIIKTYSPDLPGDFAGGLVDVKLAKPPAEFEWGLSTSMSFNTETTFQPYDTYDGYPVDWLTFGDNPRQQPSQFDIFPAKPVSNFQPTTTQMRSLIASLADNWNIDSATAPPNFNFDASIGDTWGPFGIALAGVYGWKFSVHRDEINNSFKSPTEVDTGDGENFVYDVSDFRTELGALLSSQYEIDPDHRILARALVNRQAINEVQNGRGTDISLSALDQFPKSSEYTANQLGFGALEGVHHFNWIDLDWRGSWAPSSQQIPDAKYYNYNRLIDGPPGTRPRLEVVRTSLLPQRIWTSLSEFLQDYYVDGTVPFQVLPLADGWRALGGKFKGGVNYANRDRTFLYQVFDVTGIGAERLNLALPPNTLLVPPNFSVAGPFAFDRLSYEPFDASQEIAAFYGMVDTPIVKDRLRFIAGARLEYSYIRTNGFEQGVGPVSSIINNLNPLPAVSLVYTPRDDMNVRAAFSQTVSRPEFRELTPVYFTTLPGERALRGNPNLITADITNWDLRWEWFFTPLELASAGFFYKSFTNPIELVTGVDSGGNTSDVYVNYDSATLWGFELEARKNFEFVEPWLRDVSWLAPLGPHFADVQLMVNVSTNSSKTSEAFTPPPKYIATVSPAPGEKELVAAPPFVVNAALEYDNTRWGVFRLLYNTIGSTIVAKGTKFSGDQVLADIVTTRRDQLDFVWLSDVTLFGTQFSTKLGVENILNDVFEETQGAQVTNRYRTGVTFSTGLSYSF
ncbi:MAG: TonB-dependent receptor [Candidatus Binatia bacterium]